MPRLPVNIRPGCLNKLRILFIAKLGWGSDRIGTMTFEPGTPVWPPGTRLFIRVFEPVFSRNRRIGIGEKLSLRRARRIDQTLNVTRGAQYEGIFATQ